MEALFHFIFELIKISILSTIYTSLVFLVCIGINKIYEIQYLKKHLSNKFRFWLLIYKIFAAGLFIYMWTYFGDHGLGDESVLPVGHFKVVNQSDGTFTYLVNVKGDQFPIKNFSYDDQNLYAQADFNENIDYVVWNFSTDKWRFFKTESDYLQFASKNNLLLPNKFKDFQTHYQEYWNGWRFWLLP